MIVSFQKRFHKRIASRGNNIYTVGRYFSPKDIVMTDGLEAQIDVFFGKIGKDVVIYGMGQVGRCLLRYLGEHGMRPLAISDANPAIRGRQYEGLTVDAPEDAARRYGATASFVVAISLVAFDIDEKLRIQESLKGMGCASIHFAPAELCDSLLHHYKDDPAQDAHSYCTIANEAIHVGDIHTHYLQISNGERRTVEQPATYKHTIYYTGDSTGFSLRVSDENTTASFLQKSIRARGGDMVVRNFGSATPFPENLLLKALRFDMRAGDHLIISICSQKSTEWLEAFCNGIWALKKHCNSMRCHLLVVVSPTTGILDSVPEESHVEALRYIRRALNVCGCAMIVPDDRLKPLGTGAFCDPGHLSPGGNKMLAQIIDQEYLVPHEKFATFDLPQVYATAMGKMKDFVRDNYHDKHRTDIDAWLAGLTRAQAGRDDVIGSVIVNCNPFSNGHLHLIETALDHVDYLYVFVVEEDASEFPFQDRIQLVRDGTKHLSNRVRVNPSGKFVLSSFTFNEYFHKETILTKVDPSLDIAFFGSIIAPALNITHRFVGEEPTCNVTRQYNETMTRMLPPMGVEMHVIPRVRATGGEIISASVIRKSMRECDLTTIKAMVPPTTYAYLTTHRNV